MYAPSSFAFKNSSEGVSFELNIMSFPVIPAFSARINSGKELQSAPKPTSLRILRIKGFGRAFTAKNSLNPGTSLKAAFILSAFSRMAFSS